MTNQWDLVPWMIGGGVRHSLQISRLLSYAAFDGIEGVLGTKDLEVTALPTPGAGVQVYPGAGAVQNRSAGAKYDAYAVRLPNLDGPIPIVGTGGAARTDMIVARVEDPFVAGSPWEVPTQAQIDAGTAEFIRTAVISGVGAADTVVPPGLGYSAIPLARINLPANTNVVTQAMITDLRQLTKFKRDGDETIAYPAATRVLSATTYTDWPSPEGQFTVNVPPWATHVSGKAMLGGIQFTAQSMGYLRIVLGTVALAGATSFDTGVPAAGGDRLTLVTAGKPTLIPAAMRGTQQVAKIQGVKSSTAYANLNALTTSSIVLEMAFSARPESNL